MSGQVEELEAEVAACVEFLTTEMGWEYFRAEMLNARQPEPAQLSKQNALRLKEYLEQSGHGLKFLAKHRDLEARLSTYREALERIEDRVRFINIHDRDPRAILLVQISDIARAALKAES
jgi:hypothetical protein